jgi:hypothetical protein
MYSSDKGNYDIIGDIHGYVAKLDRLLVKLGYSKSDKGFYAHPTRKVVFLGDFIDGGTEHISVINIVKPMVENEAAYAIMANHEFNAIAFHTMHPVTGLPLREHSAKNIQQHESFLNDYKDKPEEMQAVIAWFKTLPLFIDLPEIRAIHACWSKHEMKKIEIYLDSENMIKPELFDEFMLLANTKGTSEFEAIEVLLKGLEVSLPEGKSFKDLKKNVRTEIRVKWWLREGVTYADFALVPPQTDVPNIILPKELINDYFYDSSEKPVFIGHYWLKGTPQFQAVNIVCLDYSAGNGGEQVAYRWHENDKLLCNTQFLSDE